MKFLKRLNLLDYIIFIAFFLTVFLAVYNLLPEKGADCRIYIIPEESFGIKDGDLCYDISARKNLGEITVSGDEFCVIAKGERRDHGVEVRGSIYAINTPVEFYVGDYYLKGRVSRIYCDSESD